MGPNVPLDPNFATPQSVFKTNIKPSLVLVITSNDNFFLTLSKYPRVKQITFFQDNLIQLLFRLIIKSYQRQRVLQ